jgi:predicted Holliday junction resolvase-like endonuclease
MPQTLLLIGSILAAVLITYALYRFIDMRANLKLEQWKNAHSTKIRREAISGSQAAVAGRVFERVAPYLPGFGYNPKDIRFLGDPVDFVVFDGLSEGNLRNVVFVEVKTGEGDLNGNERRVKAAISERRVTWSLYRIADGQPTRPHFAIESVGESQHAHTQPGRSAIVDRGRF